MVLHVLVWVRFAKKLEKHDINNGISGYLVFDRAKIVHSPQSFLLAASFPANSRLERSRAGRRTRSDINVSVRLRRQYELRWEPRQEVSTESSEGTERTERTDGTENGPSSYGSA
jgi:hypothetical protein